MADQYVLTVYVAAPGTPLTNPEDTPGQTSAAGHMYYGIKHGAEKLSFGFAPRDHGVSKGPGKITDFEVNNYKDPRYQRTIEITKEQYEKLKDFGPDPQKFGFNLFYKGMSNSCIDFTWAALSHAGIYKTDYAGRAGRTADKNYEGSLKPLDNIDAIKSIRAPVPQSPLNKEHYNPMPPQSAFQWLLSENAAPASAHPLFAQAIKQLPANTPVNLQQRRNAATAIAVAAAEKGMTRIDRVAFNKAALRGPSSSFTVRGSGVSGKVVAQIDAASAMHTSARAPEALWQLKSA